MTDLSVTDAGLDAAALAKAIEQASRHGNNTTCSSLNISYGELKPILQAALAAYEAHRSGAGPRGLVIDNLGEDEIPAHLDDDWVPEYEAGEPVVIGWAYQDARWDKDHWHLCGLDSRPREHEGRTVLPVTFAGAAIASPAKAGELADSPASAARPAVTGEMVEALMTALFGKYDERTNYHAWITPSWPTAEQKVRAALEAALAHGESR